MSGFIALQRRFIEWQWYDDPNTMRLFVHCLIKANWKAKNWRGQEIPRGSFITSIGKLSEELGLSKKAIRTALNKLKSTGEVTTKGTAYTLVKVCKYDTYQDESKTKGTAKEPQKGTERAQKGHRKGNN